MDAKPTIKQLRVSALADRLGYLDDYNLAIIRNAAFRPDTSTPISTHSAISLALNITARVIEAGHLGRYRPAPATPDN